MNRYFSCFQTQRKAKPLTPIVILPETDLQGPLPDTNFELDGIAYRLGRRMSSVNSEVHKHLTNYQYCAQRQHLQKALQYKRLYSMKKEELQKLSARLREIQQKQDELTNPPPLQLPPSYERAIVGRKPSFKKEFLQPVTPRVSSS